MCCIASAPYGWLTHVPNWGHRGRFTAAGDAPVLVAFSQATATYAPVVLELKVMEPANGTAEESAFRATLHDHDERRQPGARHGGEVSERAWSDRVAAVRVRVAGRRCCRPSLRDSMSTNICTARTCSCRPSNDWINQLQLNAVRAAQQAFLGNLQSRCRVDAPAALSSAGAVRTRYGGAHSAKKRWATGGIGLCCVGYGDGRSRQRLIRGPLR